MQPISLCEFIKVNCLYIFFVFNFMLTEGTLVYTPFPTLINNNSFLKWESNLQPLCCSQRPQFNLDNKSNTQRNSKMKIILVKFILFFYICMEVIVTLIPQGNLKVL